eukprot:gene24898-33389_t
MIPINRNGYTSIDEPEYRNTVDSIQTRINERILMSRNWIVVFPSVVLFYVFLQAVMSGNDFCDARIEFPNWINSKRDENIPPLVANLAILLIAGSSSYLTLQYRWGGVCRDIFGVISPAAQWPEWMTSVPLLFYIAISCDASRSSLNTVDISILVAMSLTIFLGFLLNLSSIDVPVWVFGMLLFLSCCGVLSVIALALLTEKELVTEIRCAKTLDSVSGNFEMTPRERLVYVRNRFKRLHYTMKKKKLAIVCLVGMPLFPIIYFLSALKIIQDSVAYAAFMFAGMVTKSIIATIIASSQMFYYDNIEYCVAMQNLKQQLSSNKSFVRFAENKYHKMNFTALSDAGGGGGSAS